MDNSINNKIETHIKPLRDLVPDNYWDTFLTALEQEAWLLSNWTPREPVGKHDNPKTQSAKFGAIAGGIQGLSNTAMNSLKGSLMTAYIHNNLRLMKNEVHTGIDAPETIIELVLEALANPPTGNYDGSKNLILDFCMRHLNSMRISPNSLKNSDSYRIVEAIINIYGVHGYGYSPAALIKKMR